MKISTLFAATIPELRGRTWDQLLQLWSGCAGYSRNKIYLHLVVLFCFCSVIFNLVLHFSDSVLAALTLGVALGLTVPPNLYFLLLFKNRRQEIRQFILDHWDEFPQT